MENLYEKRGPVRAAWKEPLTVGGRVRAMTNWQMAGYLRMIAEKAARDAKDGKDIPTAADFLTLLESKVGEGEA